MSARTLIQEATANLPADLPTEPASIPIDAIDELVTRLAARISSSREEIAPFPSVPRPSTR